MGHRREGKGAFALALALTLSALSCASGDDGGEPPLEAAGAPALVATAAVGPDTLSAPVEQRLAHAPSARVIVNLRVGPGATIATARRAVLARAGAELQVFREYSHIPAVAGDVTAAGFRLLRADPDVASVQIDEPGAGHLAESIPLMSANIVQSFGLVGQGVRAAVLDTGIDVAHPDLSDDLFAQQCFTAGTCPPNKTNTGTSAQDENGHGTNVAGIITAKGVVSAKGFAPATKIAAVRVLDQNSAGFVSDWVAGLNWVIANQATLQVRVLNMSLGTNLLYAGNCDASQPALASATAQLNALGVIVFASTGNQGSSSKIAAPACNSGVIAVGATYDSNQGLQPPMGTYQTKFGGNFAACADANSTPARITCFTNSSSMMDIVGPGASLTTSGLNGGLSTYTGTSQASPTAAAIASLMLECNPTLTPAQIEATLKQSGSPLMDPKNGQTFPSINALAAVTTACPCVGKVCGAQDSCHVAGTCAPATGVCSNPPKADGSVCDGNACIQGGTCSAGVCTGAKPVVCVAMDACHDVGTCEPKSGICSTPQKADGTPCPGGVCMGGACVPPASAGPGSSAGNGSSSGSGAGSGGSGGGAPGGNDPGGCGCGVSPSSPVGGALGLVFGLLLVSRRRRDRRRSSSLVSLRLWAALGFALALGCRRSDEPARMDPLATSPAPSAAVAEAPPTEAEAVPEIRALIEKAAREGTRMRFWRLGAGTPGPDGWVSAAPTGGGFEIELPVPFNDFQQTSKATDGVPLEITSIGGPWAGGKVSCSRLRRKDGSPSPVPKRSMREDWLAKPGTLSASDRTWEGFPAVEVEAKNADMHALMMFVDAGPGGTFTVTAELPEATWAAHRADVDRLVHSLKTKLAPPAAR